MFKNVVQTEKWILVSVASILVSSYLLLFLAIQGFGSGVANCVSGMKPFEKGEVIQLSPTHYEIHYVARMWSYEPADVNIPPFSTVDIYLTSADVVHGFIVPGTNVNMMAVPGTVNYVRTRFVKPGVHPVYCHEYCGAGHQQMSGMIHVSYPAEHIEQSVAETIPLGRRIMNEKGCIACHTVDGTGSTGPTFKGLYGSTVTLADGSTATANDKYLKESMLQPMAKVVKGFQPIMPTFQLTEDDIRNVTEYIKTLK